MSSSHGLQANVHLGLRLKIGAKPNVVVNLKLIFITMWLFLYNFNHRKGNGLSNIFNNFDQLSRPTIPLLSNFLA